MSTSDSDLPPQHPIIDDDLDRPHRPADDREHIYFQGTPLLRGEMGRLIVFVLFGLILIAIPILWRLAKSYWPAWPITLVCFVIGIAVMFVPWLLTKFIHYRISNYRIDYEHGLLSKSIDTLELWHVEDISFHQSLVDRILGVGTIIVISHDETNPRLELKSLPNARPIFDNLKQRIIAVKRQRGVIKIDSG